jgi:hypothetical protein
MDNDDNKCFGHHQVLAVCLCHVFFLLLLFIFPRIIIINNNNKKPLYLTQYDDSNCEVVLAEERRKHQPRKWIHPLKVL